MIVSIRGSCHAYPQHETAAADLSSIVLSSLHLQTNLLSPLNLSLNHCQYGRQDPHVMNLLNEPSIYFKLVTERAQVPTSRERAEHWPLLCSARSVATLALPISGILRFSSRPKERNCSLKLAIYDHTWAMQWNISNRS